MEHLCHDGGAGLTDGAAFTSNEMSSILPSWLSLR